jgi:HEAT repeat protein
LHRNRGGLETDFSNWKGEKMNSNRPWWAVIGLCVLSACASSQPKQTATTVIPPPPGVLAPPPVQATAIDPQLQSAAHDELLKECDATEPMLRGNALEAIQKSLPDEAEQPVLKGLSDSDPGVRFAAAIAAGELRLQSAHSPLLAMANDPDPRVEVAVRFALHRLGDRRLSHELERFSISPDPQVRACTAQVLGLLGEQSAVKLLKPMCSDDSLDVKLEAEAALWRLGDADARSSLILTTVSAYPDDEMFALTALANHEDPSVVQYIRGQLTNDYLEVSLAAARALGVLGSDDGWSVAVPAAQSTIARQRALAAQAMAAIGRPDLQKPLAPLLKDSDVEVRISAAMAILQLRSSTSVAGP